MVAAKPIAASRDRGRSPLVALAWHRDGFEFGSIRLSAFAGPATADPQARSKRMPVMPCEGWQTVAKNENSNGLSDYSRP